MGHTAARGVVAEIPAKMGAGTLSSVAFLSTVASARMEAKEDACSCRLRFFPVGQGFPHELLHKPKPVFLHATYDEQATERGGAFRRASIWTARAVVLRAHLSRRR